MKIPQKDRCSFYRGNMIESENLKENSEKFPNTLTFLNDLGYDFY